MKENLLYYKNKIKRLNKKVDLLESKNKQIDNDRTRLIDEMGKLVSENYELNQKGQLFKAYIENMKINFCEIFFYSYKLRLKNKTYSRKITKENILKLSALLEKDFQKEINYPVNKYLQKSHKKIKESIFNNIDLYVKSKI